MWPAIRRIYQGFSSISLRWLGVAVLFFAAGWWLTTRTVYTRAQVTDSLPTVWFDISAGKDKVHNPTIVYLERTGSDSLALSFMVRGEEVDTSVKLELIGVDENRGCMEVRERNGVVNYEPTGESLRVEKIAMPEIKKMVNRFPFNEEYVVSAEAPKLLHPPAVYAAERLTRCYLNISPQHETYVKRKLRFIMADTLNSYLLDFTRIQGATSFQLLGGDSGGDERVRRVGRLNEVIASWEDEASAQKRDLWLLITGMVLGLAGAALLEALRPLISPSPKEP